ncbi:MAG: type II toxin-antitoxin system PemK/MazF family toxin [Syntrophobacteraceae bacterium]|jgi:mRNA interferase MazF
MVVGEIYIPDRGDIVWLDFVPLAGHEQTGRRPALVLSPLVYNRRSGLAIVVPITGKAKEYPFEVEIPGDGQVRGVILSDQIHNFDLRARQAQYITRIDDETLDEVLERAITLFK